MIQFKQLLCLLTFSILCFVHGPYLGRAHAQTTAQNSVISQTDNDLDIQSLYVPSVYDNLQGIYGKPLTEELILAIKEDTFFTLSNESDYKAIKTPSDENLDELEKLMTLSAAKASLVGKVVKGPKGSTMTLSLYSGRPLKMLITVTSKNFEKFETVEFRSEFRKLFVQLKEQIPFKGKILSRRGQEVTISIGANQKATPGMKIPVIVLTQLRRHPKLQFITGTEKEFIGRIIITKVEKDLSFGVIELEKETGLLGPGSLLLTSDFIKYQNEVVVGPSKIQQEVQFRPDKEVVFGDQPQEWAPETAPQYGKFEILLGLSSYSQRTRLATAGGLSADQNLAPNFILNGELWLNTELYLNVFFRQALLTLSNPLTNSSPGSLNMSLNQYALAVGYNLLLGSEYLGPKITTQFGFMNTIFGIDDSTPTAFTTMRYNTYVLDLGFRFPISETLPFDFGAHFQLPVIKTLNESPSSGSSSNTIDRYGFYLEYALKKKVRLKGELLFESYKSDFSGSGDRADRASTTSHRMNNFNAGIQYLF